MHENEASLPLSMPYRSMEMSKKIGGITRYQKHLCITYTHTNLDTHTHRPPFRPTPRRLPSASCPPIRVRRWRDDARGGSYREADEPRESDQCKGNLLWKKSLVFPHPEKEKLNKRMSFHCSFLNKQSSI